MLCMPAHVGVSEHQLQRQTVHLCTYLLWSAHGRKVSVAWQASLCCGSASLPRVLKNPPYPGNGFPAGAPLLSDLFLCCGLQGSGDSAAGGSSQPVKAWRERAQQRQRFWSRTTGFQMGRSLTDWGRNKGGDQVGFWLGESKSWLVSFQVTRQQWGAASQTGANQRGATRSVWLGESQ